jgi:hypothetical protein
MDADGRGVLTQRREDANPQRTGFLCAIKSLRLCVEKSADIDPANVRQSFIN